MTTLTSMTTLTWHRFPTTPASPPSWQSLCHALRYLWREGPQSADGTDYGPLPFPRCTVPGCGNGRSFVRRWVTLPHDRARFPRDTPADVCAEHRADATFLAAWRAVEAYHEANYDTILYLPRARGKKECLAEITRQLRAASDDAWSNGTPEEQAELTPLLTQHLVVLQNAVTRWERVAQIEHERPTFERGRPSQAMVQMRLFETA